MMKEFEHLEYWDKDIWKKIFETIGHKKRINNMTFFSYFNDTMRKLNSDPNSDFFKKLDGDIEKLKEKHYTADR